MSETNDELEMVPVNEIYVCLQGEGPLSGVPHILIRTVGCRLRCQFKDSFCDTSFNSWKPEKADKSWDDIIEIYKANPQIKHTLITGGGPTLHPVFIQELAMFAKGRNHIITLETEGSEFVQTICDHISLSPKLTNSIPVIGSVNPYTKQLVITSHVNQHEKYRTNYDAMKQMVLKHRDTWLKFVISTEEDINEAKAIALKLGVFFDKVYFMPEGVEEEQLREKRKWLFDVCIKEGINYTDRLHILVYGDKRGV